ncbi:hypothetical protein Tco_1444768 [Tanacetum coccineum]
MENIIAKQLKSHYDIGYNRDKPLCDPSSWMIPFWDVYLEPNCEDEAVAVSAKCTIAKRKCSVDVVDIHRVFLGLGRAHSMVMPYLLGRLRNYEFIE